MGRQKILLLVTTFVICIFAMMGTHIVNASVEPSSAWAMESGIRLEGGWPANPCIISLSNGTYRMYYTDVLLDLYPLGSIIKSATSLDGLTWVRDSGTRVGYGNGSEPGHAGSPEVVVLSDGTYRMYYSHEYYDSGIGDYRSEFLSAVSVDGLSWTKEAGIRVNFGGTYDSIRIEHIDLMILLDGTYRMYYSGYDGAHYRILSAVSSDGLTWTKEGGVRIDVGGAYDSLHALSSVTIRIPDGRYAMFYCGHSAEWAAQTLSAISTDGLTWIKEDGIRIERGSYTLVASSAIVKLSGDQFRMYITADRYPVWTNRTIILSAIGEFTLSTSIDPLSASINVGESLAFTSNVTGGMPPYNYQWYLNGHPILGGISSHWIFTPTLWGVYYVHLEVTDDTGNHVQSESANITVVALPVGGYSFPALLPATAKSVTANMTLLTILTTVLIAIKKRTRRIGRIQETV
jgi:hypothetical protein